MMVDTMLRAVFTMALVLVTMLLQINWTPPKKIHTVTFDVLNVQDKDGKRFFSSSQLHQQPFRTYTESKLKTNLKESDIKIL